MSNVSSIPIWNTRGIHPVKNYNDYRETEGLFHKAMDRVGYQERDCWVSRANATYFWSRWTDAYIFSAKSLYPAIATIELPAESSVLAVDNELVESAYNDISTYVYRSDMDVSVSDLLDNEDIARQLHKIATCSEEWNGGETKGVELWSDCVVSPESIVEVSDHEENTLQ